MKTIITVITLASILLSACQSRDGKYLVYKTDMGSYANNLNEQLKRKYADQEYVLSFADDYVKITSTYSKQSIVLAKFQYFPNSDDYRTSSLEGLDSVRVNYELRINSKLAVLTVTTKLKTNRSIADDAHVDFYLSKTKD